MRNDETIAGKEDVERFVARLAPAPACDACIAERLSREDGDRIARITSELAGSAGFLRERQACSLCGAEKMVIRKR